MVDALGELDDDELVNFVLQHVREKASPDVIVEGLEPVSLPFHVYFLLFPSWFWLLLLLRLPPL